MSKANIIINLGSPKAVTQEASKEFLRDLLNDPYVMQIPQPLRLILANFIAKKRCAHYLNIAKDTLVNGEFPIAYYTKKLAMQVEEITKIPTYAAFQIGNDNVADIVKLAKNRGATEITFLPLYPQNSYSMTQSAKHAIKKAMGKGDYKIIESYHNHPLYIDAIAQSIKSNCDCKSTVLFSFHSVPLNQLKGSPYKKQCEETVELVSQKLNLNDVKIGWQSKMGKGEWISPSTLDVLKDSSCNDINIVCAGFSCDCTETLIEINKDARAYFLEKSAKKFNYIKCLNDSVSHSILISEILGDF